MARRKIKEGHLGDMAYKAEMDHEVQMARSDLYKIAKYAVELHDMLKQVSEQQGIEGWQQSKITKAADYLGSVYHSMDYDTNVEMNEDRFGAIKNMVSKGARAANKAFSTVQFKQKARDAARLALKVETQRAENYNLADDLLRKAKLDPENIDRAIDNAITTARSFDKFQGYSTADLKQKIDLLKNDKKILTKAQNTIGSYYSLRDVILLVGMLIILLSALQGNNQSEKVDEDDVEEGNAFGKAARDAKLNGDDEFEVDGKTYKVQEGKKKSKPDYLDFDGDGNKKEPMKKALKDKKKSANESMLRTITQALKYKAGKIGVANISPKAMNLAETMITKDLKQLHTDFKKKVVAEGQFGEITHTDEDATMSEVLVKGMGVYRMDQLEQRLKDRLNNVLQLIDRGEPDQAAKLLDPNSSTYKSLMVMMKAYAEAHDELAFGDQSTSASIGEAKDTHKTKDGRTAKKGLYYNVNKRKKAGTSRPASSSKAPKPKDWKNAAKTAKS